MTMIMCADSNDTKTNSDVALDSLVDAIKQMNVLLSEDLDRRAVGLYRAMFRHEMDVNKLDFHYADHILDYVGAGIDGAVEDYKNYLQYLKCFSEEGYLVHKRMLEEELESECEVGECYIV